MSALLQDVRFGARLLARQPLLTATVVATLGFGIGANAAIFSFVNALLLRPYAFPELDALVTLWERHPQQGGQASVRPSDAGHPIAPGDFLDLRRRSRSFEALAAWSPRSSSRCCAWTRSSDARCARRRPRRDATPWWS
jgi:putative ABC transport system permease protein